MEQDKKRQNEPPTIWSTNLQQSKKEYPIEKSLFNKWCWENWTATCRTMKLDHFLTPDTKINSKCMKDLNVRQQSIKILEENTGSYLFNLSYSNYLDGPTAARETKAKMNHRDFISIESFCTEKETFNRTRKKPRE